ncbi:hypothetical protein AB0E08_08120 [Streptomyces sp. NPDC048281]|uniref:hypothetical protein n=1 Tax=Streptomyces sp. NPDC048281 TaxID=3154715 RepID=UPI0034470541
MTWHTCSKLPNPTASAPLITRCTECGVFWKRVLITYDGHHWKPVRGFAAWRLRRQFRAVKP